MDKLYNLDKRIYVVIIILGLLVVLVFFLLQDNARNTPPNVGNGAIIVKDEQTATLEVEKPLTADEKQDLEGYLKHRYNKQQNEVIITNPYDNSDENITWISQKANQPEELREEDFAPDPKAIDPPAAY